jgi:hypothetical protein
MQQAGKTDTKYLETKNRSVVCTRSLNISGLLAREEGVEYGAHLRTLSAHTADQSFLSTSCIS